MNFDECTLRFHVEKWFGPAALSSLEVRRVRPPRLGRIQCVRVTSTRSEKPLAVFFFRHQDGRWSVSPPDVRRPTIAQPVHMYGFGVWKA